MEDINFDRMGIYDLRNYARSLGVLSPTKLKRQQLIASINAILEGVEEPEKPKDMRGRPPKHKVDDMYMLDMFVPKNMFDESQNLYQYKALEKNNFYKNYNASVLSQSDDAQALDIAFDGYFVKKTENYGLILKQGFQTDYSKENAVILKDDMEFFDLRDGDFVEGTCKYIKDKNILLAKKISKINNADISLVKNRPVYEQIKAEYPSKMIDISLENRFIDAKIINKTCPICFGSRVVINNKNAVDYVEFFANLASSVEQNGINTFLISVDDFVEDIVEIGSYCENLNIIKYSSTISRENFFEKLDVFFKNACRRIELGQNVAVILYNVDNLIENIKNYAMLKYKYEQEKALIYAKNKLKDIFGLARATENGSLTVIGLNLNDIDVLQVANCQINLMDKSYFDTDVYVDIKTSNTKNIKKVLNENEYKKLVDFKNNFDQNNAKKQLEDLFKN